jgi:hypothetical protein
MTPARAVALWAAALAIVIGGIVILVATRSDDPATLAQDNSAPPSPTSEDFEPSEGEEPVSTTSANPESEIPPTESQPPDARCWDGSLVIRGAQPCPEPYSEQAMRWAFPIDWSQCTPDGDAGYNRWSHTCLVSGAPIHIATYRGTAARQGRLADYGPCHSAGEGRIVCEPSLTTDRWVRTYEDGLFFYMSAPSKYQDVLFRLPQRSAGSLLLGEPL